MEPEAGALINKWTRIWAPGQSGSWIGNNGKVGFRVDIELGLRFECLDDSASYPRDFGLTFSLSRFEGEHRPGLIYRTGYLYCFSDVGDVCIAHSKNNKAWGAVELFEQFAVQYTAFFRRGCWLSGCPIEASATEKMEWIQGFTREEIETWDLRL